MLIALSAAACKRSPPAAGSDRDRACEAACGVITGAGCDGIGLGPADHAACVGSCRAQSAKSAGQGCAEPRRAYLECVAKGAFACAAARCSAAVCLEQGTGLSCDGARTKLKRCSAPCDGEGVVHDVAREVTVGGKTADVRARVVRAGCGDCPRDLAGGAPPGSRCEAASVCGEHCCRCAPGRAVQRVRACIDQRCAGRDAACAAAHAAVPDLCE